MDIQVHPMSGARIEGSRLSPGTALTTLDVYDSTDGTWQSCPCPGLVLRRGCRTVWVRPFKVPSEKSQQLLGYLTSWENGSDCIALRGPIEGYVVIPSKNFNWDGRVDTPFVKHPECVKELIECGCLVPEEPARVCVKPILVLVVTSDARHFADVHLHKRTSKSN